GTQYGLLQKVSYIIVLFFLLPVIILTGLTMSPAIAAACPFLLKIFFGAQSARTIHFFAAVLLVLFLIVHVVMIIRTGFKQQMRAMTFEK
ncbi:MAG: cytochrome b/b6 domain-containing protein, partial [Bacteroidota bacterium]